jgi:hypothetical protein
MLSPRKRVEAAINHEWADHIPFAVYSNKFFSCEVERELRNQGMCIVETYGVPLFSIDTPEVEEKTIYYGGYGGSMLESAIKSEVPIKIARIVNTPCGTISEIFNKYPDHPRIPGELLPWRKEYLFKNPGDYAPIEFMIQNRRYLPNYEAFEQGQEENGSDIFVIPWIGYSPLQEIIINIMGIDRFSFEWYERQKKILNLYEILVEDRRKRYQIAANSSAMAIHYCGNVSPEIVGLQRFEQYILPHYNEFADLLHAQGKKLAVHFDANTRLLAKSIAGSKIDIVEAFTPYPSSDMTLTDARSIWYDKVLWINFPPAILLDVPEVVAQTTRDILNQVAPGDRFILGITEHVPLDKWQKSFSAIMDVLINDGKLPLNSTQLTNRGI